MYIFGFKNYSTAKRISRYSYQIFIRIADNHEAKNVPTKEIVQLISAIPNVGIIIDATMIQFD